MVQAGAQGSVSHHIPPQPDVDDVVVEAKCHDFGPVQEEERHNWEPAQVSCTCDCLVNSKAHQKAPTE